MMFKPLPMLTLFVWFAAVACAAQWQLAPEALAVEAVPNEAARRLDVLVDGAPFTAYIFPETIKKPVLSPLRMASGSIATRGFPPEPRPEERADHPHHVGLWFNYGDVNGLDSWNHSDTVSAMRSVRMGTVLHRRIRRVESGRGEGVLEVTTEWVNPQGQPLLREDTRFVFHAGDRMHGVDRITTLTVLRAPPGA